MPVFAFDIETIPDVELGRRIYDLDGLTDKEVGYVMQAKRREVTGSEFLSYEQQKVIAISVALRTGDNFKVWSLGEPGAPEAEIIQRFFDGIVSCRVSIEAPHRHQHQGGLYRVTVDIGAPGAHIVVGRSPDAHAAHADPYVALRDAFRAARRRLQGYARRLRGDVKSHGASSSA